MDTPTWILIGLLVATLIVELIMFGISTWHTFFGPSSSCPDCPVCKGTTCPECRACMNLETSTAKYVPATMDYGGPGAGGSETQFLGLATPDLCAAQCDSNPNCKGFSYNRDTKMCYTKTGTFPKSGPFTYYEKNPK